MGFSHNYVFNRITFWCFRPSLDEVAEWGRSFDKLMKSEGNPVLSLIILHFPVTLSVLFQLAAKYSRHSCRANIRKRTCSFGWPAKNSSCRTFKGNWKREHESSTPNTFRFYRPKRQDKCNLPFSHYPYSFVYCNHIKIQMDFDFDKATSHHSIQCGESSEVGTAV